MLFSEKSERADLLAGAVAALLATVAASIVARHGLGRLLPRPRWIAAIVVFGIYIVLHGAQTPGGGFQGGVILSTAPLLAYLAVGPSLLPQIAPERLLEIGEAIGALGYVGVGVAGLMAGGAFLQNVLPLGQVGKLWAAGTIPLLNLSSGLAVSTGFLILLSVFLAKAREEDAGG